MKKQFIYMVSFLLLPSLIMAAGLESANTFLQQVADWLRAAAIVTVTIAIMFVGYKILFGGSTLREMGPVIIGSLLIASASYIASLLMS